jgi:hypothetical protein
LSGEANLDFPERESVLFVAIKTFVHRPLRVAPLTITYT